MKGKAYLILISLLFVGCATAQTQMRTSEFREAADYSKSQRGLSLLVYKDGRLIFEEYHNGHSSNKSHMLASGTKSFSGVLLAAAIEDKLISGFDEKVSKTIVEWKKDPSLKEITLRQLLSLTSGIDVGNNGRPPTYANAVKSVSEMPPGENFKYGPAPFQVFGEVLRRKLSPENEDVLGYLTRRILKPIGLNVADWRKQEGQINLPSGAFLTAREWAKFGDFLLNKGEVNKRQIVKKSLLEELTKGSKANPNYGITFWLNADSSGTTRAGNGGSIFRGVTERVSRDGLAKSLSRDIYAAAGAGNQRLYIIPSKKMVIVRQGRFARWDDGKFLGLILAVSGT